MAHAVHIFQKALDDAQGQGSNPSSRRDNFQPFLSEEFDYYPPTLAAADWESSALSPAWASFIGRGEHSRALQVAEGELDWLERSGTATPVQIAEHQVQIGVTYLTINALDIAEDFFRKAFYNFETGKGHPHTLLELESLCGVWAETLLKMHKPEAARVPLGKLREIHEQVLRSSRPEQRPEELGRWCSILSQTINVCLEEGQHALVEELYVEFCDIVKTQHGDDSQLYAQVCSSLGEYYYARDDIPSASLRYAETRAALEKSGNVQCEDYGIACLRGAQFAETANRPEEALRFIDAARPLLDPENPHHPFHLRDLHLVEAQLALAASRNVEAVRHFDSAVLALENGKVDPAHILALLESNIRETSHLGLVEVEERWLRQSLSCAESAFGEGDERAFEAQRRLISFINREGRFGACLKEEDRYIQRVLRHYGGESCAYVEALLEKSDTQFTLGQSEAGEFTLTTALAIARKHLALPERRIILDIVEAIGDFHHRRGDSTAELHQRLLNQRLARMYFGPDSLDYGDRILRRAMTYFNLQQLEICETLCERALAVFDVVPPAAEAEPLPHATASALLQLGLVKIEQRDFTEADFKLGQAQEILERHGLQDSVAALRVADAIGEWVVEAASIHAEDHDKRRALHALLQAAEISKDLGIPESIADVLRQRRIQYLAEQLGDQAAVQRAEIQLARFLADGLIEAEGD